MKILFVLGFPNPVPAAGWTRIGFFAQDWTEKQQVVEVLGTFTCNSVHKRGARKQNEVNIFNIIINIVLGNPLVFTLNNIISFIVSMLFLLSRKPDVTVVSVPSGDVGLGALIACRLLRVKSVVDYRDEWEDYTASLTDSKIGKAFYSAVKKFMARVYFKSDIVVAVTSSYKMLLKRRGVNNVKLVPNGADTKTFRPLNNAIEREIFTVFYSGGIGVRSPAYYRLDIAVRSIKKIVDGGTRNVKLVMVGDGEVQEVLHLALELGISSNIEYKGTIDDKVKLAHLISESDVGLIPYDCNPLWKSSIPAKFYEYCACGIPVVATVYEDSLLAKIIRKNKIGITSPPMDEAKLAEAIHSIYKNKSFREVAGKRARSLTEERFDRKKIAEEFFNLVKALP